MYRRNVLTANVADSIIYYINTGMNLQVEWHRSHEEVPQDCPTIVVANEFFDALPVHHFQKTTRGWSEVLVDVADDSGLLHLRNVLAPADTPASKLLLAPRLKSLQQGSSCLVGCNDGAPSRIFGAASVKGLIAGVTAASCSCCRHDSKACSKVRPAWLAAMTVSIPNV